MSSSSCTALIVRLSSLFVFTAALGAEHSDLLADVEDRCLATALYFEARGETEQGQRAVAEAVLNRRDRLGMLVCTVLEQPGQFPWFPGRWPVKIENMEAWHAMYEVAHDELRKRLWDSAPRDQIIPLDAIFFCSGTCVKKCDGIIVDNHCFYRRFK